MSDIEDFDVGVDFSSPAKVYLEHESLGVLRDENGEPGWVEVKSSKHPDLVRLENQAKQEAVNRQNQERRGKHDNVTYEEMIGRSTRYLSEAIVSWRIVDLSGRVKNIPCTNENKMKILQMPSWDFLRKCVDTAIVEDQVFMPNSPLFLSSSPDENLSSKSSTTADEVSDGI